MDIPVSTGEVIDKWTILRIKSDLIEERSKKENVLFELGILDVIVKKILDNEPNGSLIKEYTQDLYNVNRELWDIEDQLRTIEDKGEVQDILDLCDNGDHKLLYQTPIVKFVKLARSVYAKNDRRAYLKKQLNILLNSSLVEEKSYKGYK